MDCPLPHYSPHVSPQQLSSLGSSRSSLELDSHHQTKRRRLSSADFEPQTSRALTQPEDIHTGDFFNLREQDDTTPLAKALSKQREDAVKAQLATEHKEGRSPLTAYRCPVCMEVPVDATSTICGHLFCHKCIIDALRFNESRRADSSRKTTRGSCPVCRKLLLATDAPSPRRQLIPLQLKLVTRKGGQTASSST